MSNRKENGQLAPGDKFGDYEVIKLLGQGGMGAVYLMRAKDGVQYAVKVMDVDELDDRPEFRKRFLREAEFAIKVRHPNLIPVYCVGEDRDSGLCYLVMDYMPGGSLANRLAKCKRLSVEESVSIAGQIAAALEIVHRHGVVHRDIKPENILFDLMSTYGRISIPLAWCSMKCWPAAVRVQKARPWNYWQRPSRETPCRMCAH